MERAVNQLHLDREHHLETLGLSVINSVRRGYPPEEGSHIAIRMRVVFVNQSYMAAFMVLCCV